MDTRAGTEPPRARSLPVVWLACLAQYLLPGAGYLVLRKVSRGLAALLGVGGLLAWGLAIDGQLDRPVANQVLSYLATFSSMGVGAAYFLITGSEALGRGRGDVTAASFEYGTTFVRAAGLIGFLLLLDVYDIAVGRKS